MSTNMLSERAIPMPVRTTPNGTPSLRWPSERHLLGRLICRRCRALVIVDDAPTATNQLVDVACWTCSRTAVELRHDSLVEMTPERFRALPTDQGKRRPHRDDRLCPDCKAIEIKAASARCRSCAATRREEQALKSRVVSLLGTGQSFSIAEMVRMLRSNEAAIRNAVQKARRDGKAISLVDGVLSMGVRS